MADSVREPRALPGAPADRFAALWARSGADGPGNGPPDVFGFLDGEPTASPQERLAVLLVDQRERWRAGIGRPVEDYLAGAADVAADLGLLGELVLGEFAARRDRGEMVTLGVFAARFPRLLPRLLGQLSPDDIARLAETREIVPVPTLPAEALVPGPVPAPASTLTKSTRDAHAGTTDDALQIESTVPPDGATDDDPGPDWERVAPGLPTRFTILRRLGAGGMGVVYQAFDGDRSELVALKTMRRVDALALYRFKQEFRTLADLSHPNLVDLYELIAAGDLWFYTMELVPGCDFVSHVRRAPDGDRTGLLRRALRQLAHGVNALHEAGKLHRDIKPTNVLVTPAGRVVLLDFGLTADLARSGWHFAASGEDRVVGTVAYMAPEQATGRSLSPASDWYSVGVMLFEALTGRVPFDGPAAEVLAAKRRRDPPGPASVSAGVPDDLDALCRALLDRDPDRRPTGRVVLERLADPSDTGDVERPDLDPTASHPSLPTIPAPTPVPMIGREGHLQALRAAFETVRDGRPVVMLVSGRTGSGKSTLLETFLGGLAGANEAAVLAGRCYERESVPYKALDSVVDSLSRYLGQLPTRAVRRLLPRDVSALARMFPVLRRAGPVLDASRAAGDAPDQQELRRRAVAALRELLAGIGRSQPLVLAVDDLQWGDAEDAALIEDLLRPPDAPALLLLGSYRVEDAEQSPLLRALLRPRGCPLDRPGADEDGAPERRALTLGPLSAADSRALALALLGCGDDLARAQAHLVARESGGNPLFIAELVKHVQAGERLGPRESVADGPPCGLALGRAIWARVERLPGPARRLLEVVAVSGRPVGLTEACQAAGTGSDGRAAVVALRAGRLIRGTGRPGRDEVETYHEWVRKTVVARLDEGTVARHHLSLARALESAGAADPETLAGHYQGAGRPDRASDCYARAADRAARNLAFDHAARLFRRALDLRPEGTAGAGDAEEVLLRGQLGDALADAGRGHEAAQEYLKASDSPAAGAAGALELKGRAAMQLLVSGHVDDGLAVLRAMAMAVPAGPAGSRLSLVARRAWLRVRGLGFTPRDASQVPAEALARVDLYWSAGAGLSVIDPVLAFDFQTSGLLLALRAGEPYRAARALALEAMHAGLPGRSAARRAGAVLRRAEEAARRAGHPHPDGLVDLARGLAALTAGRWRAAFGELDAAERVFRDRCTGVSWELDTVHNLSLLALTNLGALDELRRRWPRLLREARDRGDLYAVTTLSTYYLAVVRLADDEPEPAARELEEAMRHWSRRGVHIQHANALRARAAVDLYRGDPAVWRKFEDAWPALQRSLTGRVQLTRIQLTDLRGRSALSASVSADDPRPLLRAAEASARALEREGLPWSSALAALLRAGLAARRDDRESALALYHDAATRFDAAEMPLHAAASRRRAAQLDETQDESQTLAASDEVFKALGVRNPSRFANIYAPNPLAEPEGFRSVSSTIDTRGGKGPR
jgi:serine/threonine protein kinase/tetratricopeptide (TPR) repeat protein